MSYFPIVKAFKGNITFIFSNKGKITKSILSFLTNCGSSMFDSQVEQSLYFCFLLSIFFDAFKATYSFDGISYQVPISYAVRIPCNSSIVNLSRSFISSIVETLASNIEESYLNIFCTINIYQPFHVPTPSIERRHDYCANQIQQSKPHNAI